MRKNILAPLESNTMSWITDFNQTIKERISSPFWRYYITAFIFFHYKIWLALFSQDLKYQSTIDTIYNITHPFIEKNYPQCKDCWILLQIESLVYIIICPLILSIIILFILRSAEKLTATWHEKHRKNIIQAVDGSKTELDILKHDNQKQTETLEYYRKTIKNANIRFDHEDPLYNKEYKKLRFYILEYIFDNNREKTLEDISSHIKKEKDPRNTCDNKLYPNNPLYDNIERIIIILQSEQYIECDTYNLYKYTINGNGLKKLKESYKNQSIETNVRDKTSKYKEQIRYYQSALIKDIEITESITKILKYITLNLSRGNTYTYDHKLVPYNFKNILDMGCFPQLPDGGGEITLEMMDNATRAIIYAINNKFLIEENDIYKITEKAIQEYGNTEINKKPPTNL